jgi:hypothetical protein
LDIELLRLCGPREQPLCDLDLLSGKPHARIIDGDVKVAASRQRDAPVGHREIVILLGGLVERAHG